MEETIFKLTESANELYSQSEYAEAIVILLSIDRLCDGNEMDMPDEGVTLSIEIDGKFHTDLFAVLNNVPIRIRELLTKKR